MIRKHKWAWIVVAVVLVGGAAMASRMVRIRKTEKFDVMLGSEKAEVLVTNSRRAVPLLGSGARYEVAVQRESGKATKFIIKDQPRALWLLGGKMYVAAYSSAWHFAVVGAQGKIRPVSLAKLPAGPRPMNLVDDSAKWEKLLAGKTTTRAAKKGTTQPAKKAAQPAKAGRRGAAKAAASE